MGLIKPGGLVQTNMHKMSNSLPLQSPAHAAAAHAHKRSAAPPRNMGAEKTGVILFSLSSERRKKLAKGMRRTEKKLKSVHKPLRALSALSSSSWATIHALRTHTHHTQLQLP